MAIVAFMTVGLLHESFGTDRTKGFVERIDPVFGMAEASNGFIRRCADAADAAQPIWGLWTVPTIFQSAVGADRVAATLSLWQNLESVFAFAYNGHHAEALSKRKEWFVHAAWPTYVAWWVEDSHTPSWQEACERYEKLQREGPSPEAFDFKKPFGVEGQPIQIERDLVKRKVSVNMSNVEGSKHPVDIDALIGKYVAAWSEPDSAARKAILEAVWHSEGTYTDPLSQAANQAELEALIAHFLKGNPGAKFMVNGKVDCHHGHVRFYWTVKLAENRELSGMDYGEIADDGRILKIVGFF